MKGWTELFCGMEILISWEGLIISREIINNSREGCIISRDGK